MFPQRYDQPEWSPRHIRTLAGNQAKRGEEAVYSFPILGANRNMREDSSAFCRIVPILAQASAFDARHSPFEIKIGKRKEEVDNSESPGLPTSPGSQ